MSVNISSQSASGTPIIAQITPRGSRAAMSVTKSHAPRGATASRMRCVNAHTRGSSCATMRGVKPLLTSRRSRTCCGGSIVMSIFPAPEAGVGFAGSTITEMPRRELYVVVSRETVSTSAYFVTDQNPGNNAVPAFQCTGASARRSRQASCACPWTKSSKSVRSISCTRRGARDAIGLSPYHLKRPEATSTPLWWRPPGWPEACPRAGENKAHFFLRVT